MLTCEKIWFFSDFFLEKYNIQAGNPLFCGNLWAKLKF